MYRSAGKLTVDGGGDKRFLRRDSETQQAPTGRGQIGQHHWHGFPPPLDAAQIRLAEAKVPASDMHFCQHRSHRCTMYRLRRKLRGAFQLGDNGSGLAMQRMQNFALFVWDWRRYQHAALSQMTHQM